MTGVREASFLEFESRGGRDGRVESAALGPAQLRRALDGWLGLRVRGHLDAAQCARWSAGVLAAVAEWTPDFGGEQFSLGRAWYTHLEQSRARDYFADAAASDARVERHAPGLQAAMRAALAALVGAEVRPRRGWCGAGVHVFPAGEKVAREGGVVHFDLEGLTALQLARREAALSLVVMLQPPARGGGLRVWDLRYDGDDGPDVEDEETLEEADACVAPYEVGDLLVFDSYRLHQIQPFAGDRARISATLHAARIDDAAWEAWF
jgi:hypothetical protein